MPGREILIDAEQAFPVQSVEGMVDSCHEVGFTESRMSKSGALVDALVYGTFKVAGVVNSATWLVTSTIGDARDPGKDAASDSANSTTAVVWAELNEFAGNVKVTLTGKLLTVVLSVPPVASTS